MAWGGGLSLSSYRGLGVDEVCVSVPIAASTSDVHVGVWINSKARGLAGCSGRASFGARVVLRAERLLVCSASSIELLRSGSGASWFSDVSCSLCCCVGSCGGGGAAMVDIGFHQGCVSGRSGSWARVRSTSVDVVVVGAIVSQRIFERNPCSVLHQSRR